MRYAQCRTWRHGPERPYAVNRPNGPNGIIEVTRICACGRLVTRRFTAAFQRIATATTVVYPSNPRYLALPGTGGVDASRIAARAIEGELKVLDARTDQKPAKRSARKGTTPRKQ